VINNAKLEIKAGLNNMNFNIATPILDDPNIRPSEFRELKNISYTKFNIDTMKTELIPIQQEKDELSYVQDTHSSLKQNRTSVEEQINELSYDIEYFNRILAINKFLSFYTPKEIIIDELNFQQGWEVKGYKKIGRDIVKVVKKEDEHLRMVRLAGNVNANPILINDHFNNFVNNLRESGLFQNIEVMSEASKVGLGADNLQFELKCII